MVRRPRKNNLGNIFKRVLLSGAVIQIQSFLNDILHKLKSMHEQTAVQCKNKENSEKYTNI